MTKRTLSAILTLIIGVCAVAQTRVVAHRGYWKAPGAAQNSIASLQAADSLGCYASELDVWQASDGVLMVFHDDKCAKGRIEDTPSDSLRTFILKNGEPMPTLAEYLDATVPLDVRLVIEIKPHTDKGRERQAIDQVYQMVAERGLNDRVDYITFSHEGFRYLARTAPKPAGVQMLAMAVGPESVKASGGAGTDYNIRWYRENPRWIPLCKLLGLEVNIWTVDQPEDLQWCIDQGADYITTNRPDLLPQFLNKK